MAILPRQDLIQTAINSVEDAIAHNDVSGHQLYRNLSQNLEYIKNNYVNPPECEQVISMISNGLKNTIRRYEDRPGTEKLEALAGALKILKKENISTGDLEDIADNFVEAHINALPSPTKSRRPLKLAGAKGI